MPTAQVHNPNIGFGAFLYLRNLQDTIYPKYQVLQSEHTTESFSHYIARFDENFFRKVKSNSDSLQSKELKDYWQYCTENSEGSVDFENWINLFKEIVIVSQLR